MWHLKISLIFRNSSLTKTFFYRTLLYHSTFFISMTPYADDDTLSDLQLLCKNYLVPLCALCMNTPLFLVSILHHTVYRKALNLSKFQLTPSPLMTSSKIWTSMDQSLRLSVLTRYLESLGFHPLPFQEKEAKKKSRVNPDRCLPVIQRT